MIYLSRHHQIGKEKFHEGQELRTCKYNGHQLR